MRKHGTLVKIEEGRDLFLVNGVTVPKDFLHTLFAFVDQDDADKAPPYDKLIAYLSLVPSGQMAWNVGPIIAIFFQFLFGLG